jgi:hypothetical protein
MTFQDYEPDHFRIVSTTWASARPASRDCAMM